MVRSALEQNIQGEQHPTRISAIKSLRSPREIPRALSVRFLYALCGEKGEERCVLPWNRTSRANSTLPDALL
jgi:hypothetical protein